MTLAESEKPAAKRFSAMPLVWLTTAFAFGVALENFVGFLPLIAEPYTLLPILVFVVIAFSFRKYSLSIVPILLAFCWLGAMLIYFEKSDISEDRIAKIYDNGHITSGEPVEIIGRVIGGAEPAIDGVFLNIAARKISNRGREIDASGRVRMFLSLTNYSAIQDFDGLRLRHGSDVNITGVIYREDSFLNPGVTPRKEILHRQSIDATGTIKSPQLIQVVENESIFSPMALFYDLRNLTIKRFAEMFSAKTAGVLIATILGDKYFLDRETSDIFRAGGTFHILVISGLHMTFIGGLILLVVRRFTQNRWLHFLLTASAVWIYTLSVGAESPAVRASLMVTIVLFGQALYRDGNLLNSLAATALILLVLRPSDLFNPSFQLTIISVFAIVGIAIPLISKLRSIGEWTPTTNKPFPPNTPHWLTRVCEMLYWNEKVWEIESARHTWSARLIKNPLFSFVRFRRPFSWLFDAVLVSVIVQLCMLPLLVVYFHRMPVAALFLNLWVGLMIAVMSLTAVAALLILQIASILAWPFIQFTEAVNYVTTGLSGFFIGSGNHRIPVYSGDGFCLYLLYFIPVVIIAVWVFSWKPFELGQITHSFWLFFTLPLAAVIVLGGVILFHPNSSPTVDGKLKIDFLDVGQGDSALITFPNGETMLIDGGGRISYSDEDGFEPDRARIGEMVVSEFLWERGYSQIDYIMASHADADHIQGLVDVARNFEIGKAYFASVQGESKDQIELFNILERRDVKRELLETGDEFEIGGVRINILYPSFAEKNLAENDRSLVVALAYGERRFLLTGDIEREAETRLTAYGNLTDFDVVKAPHHGSRSSSIQSFINSVKPETLVISVGRRSPFGHPNVDVVERWKAAGTNVMQTGDKGMISISTDGSQIDISTFLTESDSAK